MPTAIPGGGCRLPSRRGVSAPKVFCGTITASVSPDPRFRDVPRGPCGTRAFPWADPPPPKQKHDESRRLRVRPVAADPQSKALSHGGVPRATRCRAPFAPRPDVLWSVFGRVRPRLRGPPEAAVPGGRAVRDARHRRTLCVGCVHPKARVLKGTCPFAGTRGGPCPPHNAQGSKVPKIWEQ